ncbi:O-antigen ligase family protein [Shinella oryzae]|uniref:O-antigen ligase family protein n=1 Tax=Shinella oryzae TaxID=2871820 RepID=A0ABY9K0G7_9HYPH|nr:O-antigen ligase family protein [Shinella oryzae]WLS01464.1 O-antigen ligase family protein [Shinella oryzae]
MRVQNTLDIAFIAGITFALLLGEKVVYLVLVAGIIPIPFLLKNNIRLKMKASKYRIIIPSTIYFGYNLLTYFFFTGLEPEKQRPVNPDLELYVIGIAILVASIVRGLLTKDLAQRFALVTPWALLASFLFLGALFTTHLPIEGCVRVQGAAAWPFIPALIFTTLSMLSLTGWREMSIRQRNLRLLVVSLSIVVVTILTASRGIAIAQVIALGCFLIFGSIPKFRSSMPSWRQLGSAIALGILLATSIGLSTGCGMRMISVFSVIPLLKPAATEAVTSSPVLPAGMKENPRGQDFDVQEIKKKDLSAGERFEMWETAIDAIRQAPLFGHGSLYLQPLITERYGYQHNHNQYLSWLVMGGVISLVIGLVFLSIPWLISAGLSIPDRITITLSVSVFWGMAMMFDSYFNLKFYTHYYCFLVGIIYVIVNDILVKRDNIENRA